MVKVIGYKDPNEFRNRSVLAVRRADFLDLHPTGNPMSFKEMLTRRKPVNPEDLYSAICNEGHELANLGVGGILTISINGREYLVGVNQYRDELKDYVFNIVSGYIDSKHIDNPVSALEEEVSEEVLPVIPDNRIIRLRRSNKPLPKPFQEHFQESGHTFNLVYPSNYFIRNLWQNLTLDGKPIEGNPGLYLDPNRNTAQLVFSYQVEAEGVNLKQLAVSFNQSEDYFNKEKSRVEVRYYPLGLVLIELQSGKLTDKIYHLERGNLIPISTDVLVSLNFGSKFNLDNNAIGKTSRISLLDILEQQ